MEFSVPPNILYMLLTLSLTDLVAQVQLLTFTTLADTLVTMNNHTLRAHFGIDPTEASLSSMNSLIASSNTVGMLFSIFLLMPLGESKGRKYTVVYVRFLMNFCASLFQLAAALLQATEFFLIGQFLIGAQLPLRMFITMLYVMECAPDKNRGFTSTALVFSDVIAQLFMYSVASPNVFGTVNTWYIFPLLTAISGTVFFCLNLRLPDSPKWLVRQNKMDEAARAIEFYHGKDCALNDVLTSYVREKNLTVEDTISIKQVWENDTLREALKVLLSANLFLVFDSSGVQGTYLVQLFTSAGFTVQGTMNISLILTILLFPTKFIGTYIIDSLGRRPVMVIAGIMIYVKSWLMLVVQFILYFTGPSLATQYIYLVVEFITQCVPATGVLSIAVLFISELLPPSARTSVAQCLLLSIMLINSPVVAMFPIISSFFAPGFFVPYIISQTFTGIFLYRHTPETKGRAVCDIIESMDAEVASRTASILHENTPLIRKRSTTFATKRNSILNTPRTRALTVDHNLIPSKWNC